MNNSDLQTPKLLCPQGDSACQIADQITELQRKIDRLSEQVNTDSLTQLYNRRHLIGALEQEMERTRRSYMATSVAIIDVDYFKKVNDTYGHLVGDKVLVYIAMLIKNTIRRIDVACRYGGEEFALILPSTTLPIAVQVVDRIREIIVESPFDIGEQRLTISVSIGVTEFSNTENDSIENILSRADAQLYKAKASGRNKVSFELKEKTTKAEVSQSERDALFDAINGKTSKRKNKRR